MTDMRRSRRGRPSASSGPGPPGEAPPRPSQAPGRPLRGLFRELRETMTSDLAMIQARYYHPPWANARYGGRRGRGQALPPVKPGHESLGVLVGAGGQLDESVSA